LLGFRDRIGLRWDVEERGFRTEVHQLLEGAMVLAVERGAVAADLKRLRF
jgi:hypothetical protein